MLYKMLKVLPVDIDFIFLATFKWAIHNNAKGDCKVTQEGIRVEQPPAPMIYKVNIFIRSRAPKERKKKTKSANTTFNVAVTKPVVAEIRMCSYISFLAIFLQ